MAIEWVGLTEDEENALWESTVSDWELMKRTEAKLREKNARKDMPAAEDKAGGDEPVATGTWEHLKLMMEESAWDGKIELADALANIVDFEKYYTRPQTQFDEPSSVSVRHWCEPTPGQPSRMLERVGKDHASAVAAWNTREALAQPAGERGTEPSQAASDAYDRIDHFLRNKLDDHDYTHYSFDLDLVWGAALLSSDAQPSEWVGLTAEERKQAIASTAYNFNRMDVARAIEAKLKEKNAGKPAAEDTRKQDRWDDVPQDFRDWWNGDYDDSTNPFRLNSAAYWAWAGWKAAEDKAGGEPVAWQSMHCGVPVITTHDKAEAQKWVDAGGSVRPLFARLQPQWGSE